MNIQSRKDFGQSDETIANAERTERELIQALKATREEGSGLAMREVADAMNEVYDESEIQALMINFK